MRLLSGIVLLLLSIVCLQFDEHAAFTPLHLAELKNHTKVLFRHAWDSYMDYGFPADEVRPLTCEPYGPDYGDPTNLRNDAMGNTSLTVLDNLDTLMIMEEWDELDHVLTYLKDNQATFFDQDTVVQVFEATIRWLGGLLSAHLLLTDVLWPGGEKYEKAREISVNYDGFLLVLAYDLGLRLIPAYRTTTQLPFPRINLARGLEAVPRGMNRETCTSGATTPVLEFSLLLKLTGDPQFETLSSQTFWKLWLSRLEIGLMPMSIDPAGNEWLDSTTGIGALVDSFYEYAVKGSILFDDSRMWTVFTQSYQALLTHLAQNVGAGGPTYFANVNTLSGEVASTWIDSLAAFWAGVQVLAGRLNDAVDSHVVYLKLWDNFDSIPERWTVLATNLKSAESNEARVKKAVPLEWYPLRPEFIESTYYLYRATHDPMYLQIGLRVLSLLERRYRAPCGFAGVQDIRTGQFQNRMETFVIGETLKYLYLLFDEANECFLHSVMGSKNWIFSTEAHPLWYTTRLGKKSSQLFLDRLSRQAATSHPTLTFFEELWRLFSHNQMSSAENSSFTSKDRPALVISGSKMVPALQMLGVCEVRAELLTLAPPKFMYSGFYNWDQLFAPDFRFQPSLVRPQHLAKYNNRSPHHHIELTKPFFDTYSFGSSLQSPRSPTTAETDYVLGPLGKPEDLEIYVVSQANGSFAHHDLVMPVLSGRLRMEVLVPGCVDSANIGITKEYIKRVRPDSWVTRKSLVLRINKINGLSVGMSRTVWTSRKVVEHQKEAYKISPDGRVYIQGQFVENLRVYP